MFKRSSDCARTSTQPSSRRRSTSLRELAEAAIQQANASIRQAELNLSYTRVTAPVAGVSGRAEHSIGTLIATDVSGSLLTTINQMSTVWVRFSLAQADLAKLPGGYLNRSTPVVLELLLAMNREQGTTMVMVTHEQTLAESADRRIVLRDGLVVSQ